MDNQLGKYKEAIIEVLLKRIIPLEKQLEAQSLIITELTQSLESLTKILTVSEASISNRPSTSKPDTRRSSIQRFEEMKKREEKQKEADLQEIKKAFSLGISKLKPLDMTEEKKESLQAGEPESEVEDEIDKEEELQIIDIELSQLGDFDSSQIPDFYYSDQALGAIASLAEMDKISLLIPSPPPKIRWILQLFWQVQGQSYDHQGAVKAWQVFIEENFGKLEEAFFQMRNKFDFGMINLDIIEVLLRKRKNLLEPSLFTYCVAGSHLMAILKNVIEHSGVVSAASASRYQRLAYKKSQAEE
jgi:hypothetical protein